MSSRSSLASGASTSGLKRRAIPSSAKSKMTPSASASSPPDGHTLPAGLTCGSGRASGMNLLISSRAVFHARTSPSPASAPGSVAAAPACSTSTSGSPRRSARRGGSSRTFQGWLAPIGDGTWRPSSRDFGSAGLLSATGFWTASISESPSGAVACSLSGVLQRRVSPKYSLSARAAAGILRRAEKRGRTLPTALHAALLALTDATIPTERTT